MDYIPQLPWWGWLTVLLAIVILALAVMGIIPWMGLAYFALIAVGAVVGLPALGLVVIGLWMGESNIFGKETKPKTMIQVAILLGPAPVFLALWMFGVDFLWAAVIPPGVSAVIFFGIGVWIWYDHHYVVKDSKYAKPSPKGKATPTTTATKKPGNA